MGGVDGGCWGKGVGCGGCSLFQAKHVTFRLFPLGEAPLGKQWAEQGVIDGCQEGMEK